jgi:hypothetical protein
MMTAVKQPENIKNHFAIPEKQASLKSCLPRVERWVTQFLEEIESS